MSGLLSASLSHVLIVVVIAQSPDAVVCLKLLTVMSLLFTRLLFVSFDHRYNRQL